MHYKSKLKLIETEKIYTNEPEDDKSTEIRLQDRTYVHIFLNHPFPTKISYISLENGGFNYDPKTDVHIYHHNPNKAVKILTNSINYRNNDKKTIDKIISLIKIMKISKHYF